MDIKDFAEENILKINSSISSFKKSNNTEYNDIEIKNYLQEKLKISITNDEYKLKLIRALEGYNYVKTRTLDIANKFVLYKSHLDSFYESLVYKKVFSKVNIDSIATICINSIEENNAIDKREIKFIKSNLQTLITKCLYVSSQGGFTSDILSSEFGLRTANEGDSAQFLFIGRAILAGFNCSNVDVRSSRYDAIVDVNSKLLRIQIKGISDGNIISFKDRDRGGQGIDYKHERNRGKRITSKDCDIYVAVDKQVGICYIVPMTYADTISDEEIDKVKLSSLVQFRERWDLIQEIANK